MPLKTFANPKGVDSPISKLQSDLYGYLKDTWGIDDTQYISYPRVYRNNTDAGYSAQPYLQGGDYELDAFLNDNYPVLSFFGVDEKETIDNSVDANANVHLIFFVNLPVIKQLIIDHRPDQEARYDVMEFLSNGNYGFLMTEVVTGTEKTLSDYPAVKKQKLAMIGDMQPWHCFKINLSLKYNPFTIC